MLTDSVRPATPSNGKTRSTSAVFGNEFLNETVTLAAAVELQERDKRSIIVHHRVPGKSLLHLMISLCPGCHAKVHRTKAVLSQMEPLLLELWREQHPEGHEQTSLDYTPSEPVAQAVPLFTD